MNDITTKMDSISDAIVTSLSKEFPDGINKGIVSVTLASMAVHYMKDQHNSSLDCAKELVTEFIATAPLETMRVASLQPKTGDAESEPI